MEKVTINDIARLTGLSKGTVDRVLHNRGEVSRKSYEKVMACISEMGYEPNVYASLLAGKDKGCIAVLLPRPEEGSYWELAISGIRKAEAKEKQVGISTRLFTYDEVSADSFRETCTQVLESKPVGVVIAPMFQFETQLFAQELSARNIPYVFVDTKLADPAGYLAFYGIPAYKSGYLCADMLLQGNPVKEVLVVRVMRDKERSSDPTIERRAGFQAYIREHNPQCTLRTLFVNPTDPVATDQTLSAFFINFPGVRHIVTFNSRVHLIVPFLERNPIPGMRVIGFDNLKANIDGLQKGIVSMLIAQHPDQQVQNAIHTLAEFIVFHRKPETPDNYMHMDLLTRYNV